MEFIPALRTVMRYHGFTQKSILSHLPEGSEVTASKLAHALVHESKLSEDSERDIEIAVHALLSEEEPVMLAQYAESGFVKYGAYLKQVLLARDEYAPSSLIALTFMAGNEGRSYQNQPAAHSRSLSTPNGMRQIFPINMTSLGEAIGISKNAIHQMHDPYHEQRIPNTKQLFDILNYYSCIEKAEHDLPFRQVMREIRSAAAEWNNNPVGAELSVYRTVQKFMLESKLELPSKQLIPDRQRAIGQAITKLRDELMIGEGDLAGLVEY